MITDKELLEIYMRGFNDELDGRATVFYNDALNQSSYDFGRIDAIIGDDISSVDLQTNQEILNKIKNDKYIYKR